MQLYSILHSGDNFAKNQTEFKPRDSKLDEENISTNITLGGEYVNKKIEI